MRTGEYICAQLQLSQQLLACGSRGDSGALRAVGARGVARRASLYADCSGTRGRTGGRSRGAGGRSASRNGATATAKPDATAACNVFLRTLELALALLRCRRRRPTALSTHSPLRTTRYSLLRVPSSKRLFSPLSLPPLDQLFRTLLCHLRHRILSSSASLLDELSCRLPTALLLDLLRAPLVCCSAAEATRMQQMQLLRSRVWSAFLSETLGCSANPRLVPPPVCDRLLLALVAPAAATRFGARRQPILTTPSRYCTASTGSFVNNCCFHEDLRE